MDKPSQSDLIRYSANISLATSFGALLGFGVGMMYCLGKPNISTNACFGISSGIGFVGAMVGNALAKKTLLKKMETEMLRSSA